MDYGQCAKQYYSQGYNCAQAVACAFAGIAGIEAQAAARLSAPFGGISAEPGWLCGAVSGMCLAAGAIYFEFGSGGKSASAVAAQLSADFKRQHGSYYCCELVKSDAASLLVPCPEAGTCCSRYVECAAAMLARQLLDDGII